MFNNEAALPLQVPLKLFSLFFFFKLLKFHTALHQEDVNTTCEK